MRSTLSLLLSMVLQQGAPTEPTHSLLELNDGEVNCVAFAPDGKSVAACGDQYIQLFEVERGRRTHRLSGHTKAIRCIAFNRDGQRIVSASDDNTMRLWQVGRDSAADNGCLRVFEGYAGPGNKITNAPPNGVAFSPDGKMLVSSAFAETRGGGLMLWTVKTGQWEYWARLNSPSYIAVSPSGKLVATAEQLGLVSICEWAEFGLRARFGPWTRHLQHDSSQAVSHVAFSSDGRRLLSVCLNDTMRIWDVQTGELVSKFSREDKSDTGAKQKAVISDGDRKAAAELVRRFDRENDGVIDRADAYYSSVPAARGGIWFAYDENGDKRLTVDELARYQASDRIERKRAATSVLAAEFLPAGEWIVSVTRNETIRLWNPVRDRSLTVAQGRDRRVRRIALAPDGKTLATCGSAGCIKLWTIERPTR